jgi:phage gp36-like protein
MSYCLQTDIVNQIDSTVLLQLTDDAGTGVIDAGIVTRAIADADATIDSYCQDRYTIPLSPVPAKIRQVSVDISIYNLYSRREDVVPDIRKERNQAAIRFLEKVADGKIQLGVATLTPTNTDNSVSISGNTRLFTRDKMSGF